MFDPGRPVDVTPGGPVLAEPDRPAGERLDEHVGRALEIGAGLAEDGAEGDPAHEPLGLDLADVQLVAEAAGQLERRAIPGLLAVDAPRPGGDPIRVARRRLAEVELLVVADRADGEPLAGAA